MGWVKGCREHRGGAHSWRSKLPGGGSPALQVSLHYSGGKELGSTCKDGRWRWFGDARGNRVSLTSRSACWWVGGGRQADIGKTKCSLKRGTQGVGKRKAGAEGGLGSPRRHHRGSDDWTEFWRRRILAQVIPQKQTARHGVSLPGHVLEVLSGLMGLSTGCIWGCVQVRLVKSTGSFPRRGYQAVLRGLK